MAGETSGLLWLINFGFLACLLLLILSASTFLQSCRCAAKTFAVVSFDEFLYALYFMIDSLLTLSIYIVPVVISLHHCVCHSFITIQLHIYISVLVMKSRYSFSSLIFFSVILLYWVPENGISCCLGSMPRYSLDSRLSMQ